MDNTTVEEKSQDVDEVVQFFESILKMEPNGQPAIHTLSCCDKGDWIFPCLPEKLPSVAAMKKIIENYYICKMDAFPSMRAHKVKGSVDDKRKNVALAIHFTLPDKPTGYREESFFYYFTADSLEQQTILPGSSREINNKVQVTLTNELKEKLQLFLNS